MKRHLIVPTLALAALAATSCLHGGFSANYAAVDDFEVQDFLTSCPDSVFSQGFFVGSSGKLLYNINSDEDQKVQTGGFSVSWKRDRAIGSEAETCNQFCVLNSTTDVQSMFAVYHQNPDPKLNPKDGNDIVFIGRDDDTCTPVGLFVANTAQVATLIARGSEDFEPFREGDYLRIVITGYKNGVKGSSVTMDLAKFSGALTLVNEWKQMDLATLGPITSMDVNLETNREGLPLYVCIDNVVTRIQEEG